MRTQSEGKLFIVYLYNNPVPELKLMEIEKTMITRQTQRFEQRIILLIIYWSLFPLYSE